MEPSPESSKPPPPAKPVGTVLAFDFGQSRIGIAVGESLVGTARPLQTLDALDNDTRFNTIAKLVAEWQPVLLVVGVP